MNGRIFIGFLGLTALLRLPSWWVSVIDHDESTYIVIAQQLLQGKVLYADLCDTKPPGIFLIFGGIISLFGTSVAAIRAVTCVAIAFTAWVLYIINRRCGATIGIAILSGLAYILGVSAHRWGMAANTELWFNACTATAWCWGIPLLRLADTANRPNNAYLYWALVGLTFGIGFVIKYVVLLDFGAFIALIAIWRLRQNTDWRQWVRLCIGIFYAVLAFALPFAMCWAWFDNYGYEAQFADAVFGITRRYPSAFNLWHAADLLGRFALSFLPLCLGAIVALGYAWRHRHQHSAAQLTLVALPLMCGAALVAAILPGKGFSHYLLQPLLPLSLWAFGAAAIRPQKRGEIGEYEEATYYKLPYFPQLRRTTYLVAFLGLCCLGIIAANTLRFVAPADTRRDIATWLAPRLHPADLIYAPAATILYAWLDRPPLSPYVHSTLLSKPDHQKALQIDVNQVLTNIVGQCPRFVVIETSPPPPPIAHYIAQYCILAREYDQKIAVYSCYSH